MKIMYIFWHVGIIMEIHKGNKDKHLRNYFFEDAFFCSVNGWKTIHKKIRIDIWQNLLLVTDYYLLYNKFQRCKKGMVAKNIGC